MIAVLIGFLVALGNGATDVRLGPDLHDGRTVVEYVAPTCPSFVDESCYVIVAPDLSVEVGP